MVAICFDMGIKLYCHRGIKLDCQQNIFNKESLNLYKIPVVSREIDMSLIFLGKLDIIILSYKWWDGVIV